MGKVRGELLATPCEHCGSTGKEPEYGNQLCSVCLGVQYVDAETGEAFDEFDAVRFLTLKLLRRKDKQIKDLKLENNRLQHQLVELKPYMDMKRADDISKQMTDKSGRINPNWAGD